MESTQGLRWDAAVAAVVTVTANAGLFWLLTRMMRPEVPVVAERALQVVWIPRDTARREGAAPTAHVPRSPALSRLARTVTASAEPDASPDRDASSPSPVDRPMSAVYLMQARQAAQAPVAIAPGDPFAQRIARLPGEGSERFRMRQQTSVATVVNGIGRMFGARDPDEPCRENRRNIGDLALDGDSAVLQQQLDYERRLCRP
ncbi:hypothetical protein QLQ15_06125 [Lysobacter sp. LF1]|uniref:Uncharacterized protein n=1 Tax=Lysobacter stagni TaxID=3045172 RepID=A0ABT6XEM3_9GAMM|nr:hypothetical protein [Lysobacter sp. LF1]MDI9238489.1 hypothetical protein [Lysobacter sp. LF1]